MPSYKRTKSVKNRAESILRRTAQSTASNHAFVSVCMAEWANPPRTPPPIISPEGTLLTSHPNPTLRLDLFHVPSIRMITKGIEWSCPCQVNLVLLQVDSSPWVGAIHCIFRCRFKLRCWQSLKILMMASTFVDTLSNTISFRWIHIAHRRWTSLRYSSSPLPLSIGGK